MIAVVPDPTVGAVPEATGSPWLSIGSTWVAIVVGAVLFAVAVAVALRPDRWWDE